MLGIAVAVVVEGGLDHKVSYRWRMQTCWRENYFGFQVGIEITLKFGYADGNDRMLMMWVFVEPPGG